MSHRNSDSGSFVAVTRHDEFYINGGDLFFLIDNVQFRVHRYFFERESSFFRGKLTTPASPGASRLGVNESSAIILEGVRPAEFAKFLWVFYNPRYSLYKAPIEDWMTILSLSHRWSFPEVKSLAVREMEKLPCPEIDRIVAYHDSDVDRNLLIPRYAALCEREEPLTLPEGLRLGMETTLMIARAREYSRASIAANGLRSPTVSNVRGNELHKIVRELFGIPIPVIASPDDVDSPISPVTSPVGTTNGTSSAAEPVHVNGASTSEPVHVNGTSGKAADTTVKINGTTAAPAGEESSAKEGREPAATATATTAGESGAPASASGAEEAVPSPIAPKDIFSPSVETPTRPETPSGRGGKGGKANKNRR